MSQPLTGTVVAAFGRQYAVRLEDGRELLCVPRAKKSEVACGDAVEIALTSADQGVIERIRERSSLFYRADQWKEKLIAANVSQVVVVVATEPGFSDELITRCLVAADAQDIPALIVLNKCDLVAQLPAARAQLEIFVRAGHEVLALSAREDVAVLRNRLAGHTSLLVGQSGMGKSTLTNALVPDAEARTREISAVLDSGKHTTTHARLYPLPADTTSGGFLIDSPGLQSFGLAHLSQREIETGFLEIRPLLGSCRFRDCQHLKAPDCALRAARDAGDFSERRYATLLQLLDEHRVAVRHRLEH
ncbi:MAG: ribosome small subunit-dependent GTPase A [Candidatus Dactylopiibacterium carminicum]|nr:MAG: ribosome small subunit-dependent GTPase A [Candidatus Dactylopiibacterium carminicum]